MFVVEESNIDNYLREVYCKIMTVSGLLIVLVDAFHFMAVFFNKINFTCRLLDLLSCQNITDKADPRHDCIVDWRI